MTGTTPLEGGVPQWVDAVHGLVLHGTPDHAGAQELRCRWNDYFAQMVASTRPTRSRLVSEVTRSVIAHGLWRIHSGPPTHVAQSLFLFAIGLSAILFALTPTYAFASTMTVSGGIAILGGIFLWSEASTTTHRSTPQRLGLALFIVVAIGTGLDFIISPPVPAYRVAGLGILLCAPPMALHLGRDRRPFAWRRWVAIACSITIIAFANLATSTQYTDASAAMVARVLFVIELAAAVSLMRWSMARRAHSAAGTKNHT